MLCDVRSMKTINERSFGLEDTTYTAVQRELRSFSSAVRNLRIFQHILDLTVQLLAVQLKLKVKLYVYGIAKKSA